MTKKIVLVAIVAVAVICLGAAAALVVLLFAVGGNPLPGARSQSLLSQAQASACPPGAQVAAGSFLADPTQNVGDWTLMTYGAVCNAPGQPPQPVSGYYAIDGRGRGCGGTATGLAVTALPSASLTVVVQSAGQCGGASGPGSLSVYSGLVSGPVGGPGLAAARANFAGGESASAPIRAGRFILAAPGGKTLCSVAVLDGSAEVLQVIPVGTPGQAGCP